jgi:hypothetical protein
MKHFCARQASFILSHNRAMQSISNVNARSQRASLALVLGFGFLSIVVHLLVVGWVGGALETASFNPSLRDTPISVSLGTTSTSGETSPVPAPKPVPKPALASKSKAVRQTRTGSAGQGTQTATSSVEVPMEPTRTEEAVVAVDPKAVEVSTEANSNKPKEETGKDLVKPGESGDANKPPADLPLFPGGLGSLPLAGSFPYTFYLGDYTLNNALGAGSFIVESGDGKYKLVLIAKASGLTSLIFSGVTYRSEGFFGGDGFAPELYAEKTGSRAERAAQVNYATKEATLGDQKRPTLVGMQDRLSVIWQVGLVLRAKPEYSERGKTLPIPLMSTRSLDNAQFVSQGVVDFDKRGVLVKAAHFKFRPANPANKTQIDLWYDLSNLPQPLRVRWIDERDRTYDIFRDD